MLLRDRGKAATRHAIQRIVRDATGEEFHHSVYTLRLREYEKRELISKHLAVGAGLYEITDRGIEIAKKLFEILTTIDPEKWSHTLDNIQNTIKRILEVGR